VTKAFTRAAKRAGWPEHASPVHGLRHAAASLALAGGIDLAVISRRLGYSSAAATAQIICMVTLIAIARQLTSWRRSHQQQSERS